MAKIKTDIDEHLDGSSEAEYLNLIKTDGSFEHTQGGIQLVPESFTPSAVHVDIKPVIDNSVTYKLVTVPEDDTSANMQDSPVHDTTFFVISNPVEVFGAPTAVSKKSTKTIALNNKSKTLTKKRDDKRRATHNEVERRRRDKINNWIMKLADLVPNSRMPDSASKGGILAKACDYIVELTERQKRLETLEEDNENLVHEVLRLKQELAELRKTNTSNGNLQDKNHLLRHKGQKS